MVGSTVIASVVEGIGEVESVPILIRQIAQRLDPPRFPHVPRPIRIPRQRLVKSGEFERTIAIASMRVGGSGGVLVLIDSDDDRPADLGPRLLRRAQAERGDIPVSVVLAHREYEAWFLASALSLGGFRYLRHGLAPPPNPEAIRDAKGWLTQNMAPGRRYKEIADQPAFTTKFDLAAARTACSSFDKCYREIVRLLHASRPQGDDR